MTSCGLKQNKTGQWARHSIAIAYAKLHAYTTKAEKTVLAADFKAKTGVRLTLNPLDHFARDINTGGFLDAFQPR